MAKKQRQPRQPKNPSTSSVDTNTFVKGMNKDFNPSYEPKQNWTHARNAANNSADGDVGMLGNEPANIECGLVPYTVIGTIHLYADKWAILSTNNVDSEIGIFDDSECTYETIVNDQCLNFNKKYLITGAAKENFDCTWQIYWDDSLNPSRTLNLENVPYKQIQVSSENDPCIITEDGPELDCEKIRLAPLLDTPCIKLTKAPDGGQLRNGSYQAFIAYTLNEQKVSDYIGISNIQSLFNHNDTAGALDIEVSNLDKEFEFFELVILSNNSNNYQAKKIGLYSTEVVHIGLDYIDQSLPSVALEQLPFRTPAYEKSDSMFVVNDWLIRKGPTEQFDFNYQPIANQIQTKWTVAEYPASYYYKGGNKVGFMRDEVYSFFIRWIYNTGERSKSYHIPGRPPKTNGWTGNGEPQGGSELAVNNSQNTLDPGAPEFNWQVFNTGNITQPNLTDQLPDGGIVISKGEMAYWESTEKYPATQPEIWNATYVDPETNINIGNSGDTAFDLCGLYIRHHKFPTEEVDDSLKLSGGNDTIRVLGVEFGNIKPPLYNDGTIIENIVGYELLRGSREGNKSILAKGIFRNMREYTIPSGGLGEGSNQGLYPNFPYNDLRGDVYHWQPGNPNAENPKTEGCDNYTQSINGYAPLSGFRKDVFTVHSPELQFKNPFLNAYETRMYGYVSGKSVGNFIKSENHPQNKLLRNAGAVLAGIIGAGYAIQQIQGTQSRNYQAASMKGIEIPPAFVGVVPPIISAGPADPGYLANIAAQGTAATANTIWNIVGDLLLDDATSIASLFDGGATALLSQELAQEAQLLLGAVPGWIGGRRENSYTAEGPTSNIPEAIKVVTSIALARGNIAVGSQAIIDLFYNLVKEDDFAFKHNSHGYYNNFSKIGINGIFRTKNIDSNYIGSSFQTFGDATIQSFKINNLFRPSTVAVNTSLEFDNPPVQDRSRYVVGGGKGPNVNQSSGNDYMKRPERKVSQPISAFYGALKFQFENQYGQLDSIKQIQMRSCVQLVDITNPTQTFTTEPIFSGDTYVNRYTEKVIMPIFTDFLNGQPDQYTYNYLQRINIPYPRYWMDTRLFDTQGLATQISTLGLAGGETNNVPSDLFYLDRPTGECISDWAAVFAFSGGNLNPPFNMKYGYMYTHCNGVQDFYCESELNIALRDHEDQMGKRHYDTFSYSNVDDLFHADIIKKDNFYKYDFSLSVSKFLTQISNFGEVQTRDYDPYVAERCFSYYPKRLIYSLQAQKEAKKDFWRVFLPNNYKDFKNPVNVIKPINKSGAIIFFPYQSPQMFQGLDTLKTDLGTKLTLGDGGLFSQPFQNIANSDLSNEYGSCESHRAVMNTPMGLFFLSQAQGKVFHYTGKLENIANQGMKWWFNKYLPSQLIKQFPELEETPLADNPVVGVGCQVIYDTNDDIVYFCKKDYKLKPKWTNVIFDPDECQFYLIVGNNNPTPVGPGGKPPVDTTNDLPVPPSRTQVGKNITFAQVQQKFDGGVQLGTTSYTSGPVTPKTITTGNPRTVFTWICEGPDPNNLTCQYVASPLGFATQAECEAHCQGSPPPPTPLPDPTLDPILNPILDPILEPEPTPITAKVPITLGDPKYFNDASWTVSYDPKAKAWISFHDWHPELCLPSINHFLTTKTIETDEPYCPPGYTFNPANGQCEITLTETAPAVNVVEELPVTITGGVEQCLLDVVIANDTSGSTLGQRINAQCTFISGFINDPIVQSGMASGNIQIGITSWSASTQQQSMNPNGFSMSNTITAAQVQAFMCNPVQTSPPGTLPITYSPAGYYGSGTNEAAGINHAHGIRQQRAASQLGDRSANPNFRSVIIFITDSDNPTPTNNIYCNIQSNLAGGNNANTFEYTYALFCGANSDLPPQGDLNTIACQPNGSVASRLVNGFAANPYQYSINAQDPATVTGASNAIAGEVCGTPPVCDCPPGYTMVFPDGNGLFTASDGPCDPDRPPICRKITCDCPTPPFAGATTTDNGAPCDDIYQVGNPSYINPNPKLCTFFFQSLTPPSYERGSIWRHNYRCDLFANYYGEDYPWEVEFVENSGQIVNTVRNLEYQLESYVYKGDMFNGCGDDRWHDLDFNFDEAIVHNTEQVSGLLRINEEPKNDPLARLTYPQINLTDIDVVASKIEQKYRINQFWDITDDRGEFTNAEQQIFFTQENGYIRDLNSTNLNYEKDPLQHKKFRHYYNKFLLRRRISNDRKMLLKLNNTKLNLSFR
tara:strand:+ start:1448 stop:8116 length:6669 start_codon:yes stop_codon:yes gene_type:complete